MIAEQIRDGASSQATESQTFRRTTGDLRAYAVAILLLVASLLVRWTFRTWFDGNIAYLQFLPAIMVAAWYGGLGPGLFATALSALAAMYFSLPVALGVGGHADIMSLGFFVAIGAGISWLNHQLRTAAVLAATRAERLDAIIDTTVDERVRLRGELGASEARWKAVIDSAVDGIIVIDAHGHVEAFNPGAERLFGYSADEVLGRNVNMLMPNPYREEHDTYLARYHATGRAKIIGIGREVQGLRKDGTTFPLHLSVGQITVNGERKFSGILHDLTGRVQMEAQLREQAALAKLGEMAAVIAHEVKNPLAGIRGAIQVFGKQIVESGAKTHVQVMKEIVSRIDALDQMMKDLLLFARPPKPQRSPTEVVPLVTATANLLSEDPALKDVDVEIEGAAPTISADPDMLKIVFQNLLINSAHAMKGKGRIRVSVGTIDSACQIAFIDSGPGIPSEIREKIFTPFFTTKARGSGLGLPTAKRLIDAHEGQIAIDCPSTGGTAVVIRLPMGGG
jgi:two-component system, LuxR family, sensor kinase FixL